MASSTDINQLASRAASVTPPRMAKAVRGLSDQTLAWIFIAPTVLLLLVINIFPLLWTAYLSFTDYTASDPARGLVWIGAQNYLGLLADEMFWNALRVTAYFVGSTIFLQVVLGFALAWAIHRQFKGNGFWTMVIVLPMMLSPAVVGNLWAMLYQPQIGLIDTAFALMSGAGPSGFHLLSRTNLAFWSLVVADTWMWTPFVMLICLAGLKSIPEPLYEAAAMDRATPWRQFWTITVPMVLPFLLIAVLFRGIENLKMFDLVAELTGIGPGQVTELASINLKRGAFDNWRTGYGSAFAVVMFVAILAMARLYIAALNRVAQR